MENLLPSKQSFWFHLSFYSSLYKLINRKIWIKKASFFIFCIAGALSTFHTAVIAGGLDSLFSFQPAKADPFLPALDVAALLLGTSHCCQQKILVSFVLRTKPAPAALHADLQHDFGPSQAGEVAASLSIFQHPSDLHLSSTAWLGWWMCPASLCSSGGVRTDSAMYLIYFIFRGR